MPYPLFVLLQKGVKCKENVDLMNMVYRLIDAILMMAPPGGNVPDRFHHPAPHGDVLIPAIYHNVLLAAMQKKPVARLERHGAIGA
jgi:hypothetical protein